MTYFNTSKSFYASFNPGQAGSYNRPLRHPYAYADGRYKFEANNLFSTRNEINHAERLFEQLHLIFG